MQPYATDAVSLGSAEEPYDSDMTHSYRLTEGRLIRYPMSHGRVNGISKGYNGLWDYPTEDAKIPDLKRKNLDEVSKFFE